MNTNPLQPVIPRHRTAGLDAVGKIARGVSTIGGGVLLGAEFGLVPAIGVGLLAATIYGLAEGLIRR